MPYCPKCKGEYEKGITVCSDCNIPLVESLPKEQEEDLEEITSDRVEVYRTENEKDAEEKLAYLKKNGIEAVISELVESEGRNLEVFGGKIWFQILVEEDVSQKAEEFIQKMINENIKISEEEIERELVVEKEWRCARCGAILNSADDVCMKCLKELGTQICSNCGYILSPDDEVCPKCGSY